MNKFLFNSLWIDFPEKCIRSISSGRSDTYQVVICFSAKKGESKFGLSSFASTCPKFNVKVLSDLNQSVPINTNSISTQYRIQKCKYTWACHHIKTNKTNKSKNYLFILMFKHKHCRVIMVIGVPDWVSVSCRSASSNNTHGLSSNLSCWFCVGIHHLQALNSTLYAEIYFNDWVIEWESTNGNFISQTKKISADKEIWWEDRKRTIMRNRTSKYKRWEKQWE